MERKKDYRFNLSLNRPYEGGFLNQLPPPITLMENFYAHNLLWGSKKNKHKRKDAISNNR